MHKYEVIIRWSNEDQIFIAEIPELPGCVTHGSTHEFALANAQEAIQLQLDSAQESANLIPEPQEREYPLRAQPIKYLAPTGPVWPSDLS